jgi:cell wall-associated NlpC family hydrolase
VFCLGVIPAATGAKETVQASEYLETETETETEKPLCEITSNVLSNKSVIIGRTQTFSIESVLDVDYYTGGYVTPQNVTWSVTGSGVSIVSQATDGLTYEIKAESVGTATISVTYDMEYSTNIYRFTSTATISSIEKPVTERISYALDSESGYVGNSWTFSLANVEDTDYDSENHDTVTPKNVTWSVTGDAVSIVSQETNGQTFEVKAEKIGTATVTVTYDMEYYNYIYRCTSTATITITEKPVYEENSYVLNSQSIAKGKTLTLSIADVTRTDDSSKETITPKNVKWKVKGKAVSVTSKKKTGNTLKIKGAKTGKVTVSVTYDMEYSSYIYRYTSTATIYVSNPKLSTKTIGINKYTTTYGLLYITGCNEYSTVTCTTSSKKVSTSTYYDWNGSMKLYVNAKKKGAYTVKLNIDGKTFTVKVKVFSAYFKRSTEHSVDTAMDKKWYEGCTTLVLYKGAKETLTVKGVPSGTKVKWTSSNKKVATVNQKGIVLGKGNGYCTITASFGGASMTYEVGVTSKTAAKAVYYAIKHFGSTYSQAERMSVGKYDCSSYVFRSYLDAGKTLGTSSKWAPTAADLAKWCNEKGYVLYTETQTVDFSKLLPGDLIFETGENNGRYKGIYHVDLYVGNGYTLTVERTKYWGNSATTVIVARPCK